MQLMQIGFVVHFQFIKSVIKSVFQSFFSNVIKTVAQKSIWENGKIKLQFKFIIFYVHSDIDSQFEI